MGNSIIKDIFYLRHVNFETVKMNESYKKLLNEFLQVSKDYMAKLGEEGKKQFENICDLTMGLEAEANCEHFKEGFKLGLMLGAECFSHNSANEAGEDS